MKYDFTEIQRRFDDSGMTLTELETATRPCTRDGKGIDYSTISKAFLRGTASKRTATALAKVFRLPYKRLAAVAGQNVA